MKLIVLKNYMLAGCFSFNFCGLKCFCVGENGTASIDIGADSTLNYLINKYLFMKLQCNVKFLALVKARTSTSTLQSNKQVLIPYIFGNSLSDQTLK